MVQSALGLTLRRFGIALLVSLGGLGFAGCAPRTMSLAAAAPPSRAAPIAPHAESDANDDASASNDAARAIPFDSSILDALLSRSGSMSAEERHHARIAMARAALVALSHAKEVRDEREDLETQLQRELEAHAAAAATNKSRSVR
jgi:hypothetical protein